MGCGLFLVVLYAFYFNDTMKVNFSSHLATVIVVFVVMARCYNHCARKNEVDIVLIADCHYQKYIEQEERLSSNKKCV